MEMNSQDSKLRAGSRTRPLLLVLAGVLAGLALQACGETTNSSSQKAPAAAVSDKHQVPSSNDAVEARRRFAGDYDEDDGFNHIARGDGDDDDVYTSADGDGDSDSSGKGHYDSDDTALLDFGRAPTASARRQIVALIKRYYAAVVGGDDAEACSLIDPSLARLLPATLGEGGPLFLHRLKSCSAIVAKVFQRNRPQLTRYNASLGVADVRVDDGLGLVILSFKGLSDRKIEVILNHGEWKMDSLVDTELP